MLGSENHFPFLISAMFFMHVVGEVMTLFLGFVSRMWVSLVTRIDKLTTRFPLNYFCANSPTLKVKED